MMDAVERYKFVVNKLNNMSQSQEFRRQLGPAMPRIDRSVSIMVGHLDGVLNNRIVIASQEAKKEVFNTALLILSILVRGRLTKPLIDYINLWYELAVNWNSQVGFDENLKIVLDAIGLLLGVPQTISDMLNAMVAVAQNIGVMTTTQSSGVKLAGMYMNALKEMIEGEKNTNRSGTVKEDGGGK